MRLHGHREKLEDTVTERKAERQSGEIEGEKPETVGRDRRGIRWSSWRGKAGEYTEGV